MTFWGSQLLHPQVLTDLVVKPGHISPPLDNLTHLASRLPGLFATSLDLPRHLFEELTAAPAGEQRASIAAALQALAPAYKDAAGTVGDGLLRLLT